MVVRGNLYVSGVTLSLNQFPGSSYTTTWSQGTHSSTGTTVATGGLVEDFAGWGGYTTNLAAVGAWSPCDYQQLSLQGGQDHGSCTCSSTTQVVITSSNTSQTFAADALDQTVTGQHAILTVFSDVITGVTQMYSARVVSNTAMSAGGSATLTLDQALPSTNYNSYFLYALGAAGNVVWRRYYVVNRSIAAAMQQVFPYPFAFRNQPGNSCGPHVGPGLHGIQRPESGDRGSLGRSGERHHHDDDPDQPGFRRWGRDSADERAGIFAGGQRVGCKSRIRPRARPARSTRWKESRESRRSP